MTIRLTDRDTRLLVKCAVCRWLTTTQAKHLYFPQAGVNAVQKRLRKLSEAGYLRSHREHPTAEAVHTVGPKGKPLVEERGVDVVLGGEVPKQLAHLVGVNDVRVAVETSAVRIAYFFAYWQLPDLGWTYHVIPDAIFAVRTPERRTFFVEYDRNTETLKKLIEKLQWYVKGLSGFPFEAVVIVTERTRRLALLSRDVRKKDISARVLASTLEDMKEEGFFGTDFLEVPGGEQRKVLDPPEEKPES